MSVNVCKLRSTEIRGSSLNVDRFWNPTNKLQLFQSKHSTNWIYNRITLKLKEVSLNLCIFTFGKQILFGVLHSKPFTFSQAKPTYTLYYRYDDALTQPERLSIRLGTVCEVLVQRGRISWSPLFIDALSADLTGSTGIANKADKARKLEIHYIQH